MSKLLLLLLACGSAPSEGDSAGDGGGIDGGTADGGSTDGGSTDGGSTDGGSTDGGSTDGGSTDGGSTAMVALVINELMADNETAIADEDGAFSDWVELYNTGTEDLDLSGFGISDDWTDPQLYTLPEGTSLPAGAWLLLWADGSKEPGSGHLPFRLDADGEAIGVFTPDGEVVDWVVFADQDADTAWARLPDGAETWEEIPLGTPGSSNRRLSTVEEEVIAAGSTWSYWDGADSPGTDWTQRAFDDGDWQIGPAPLGYGDAVATEISYGGDSSAKHETAWFRTRFVVEAGRGDLSGGTLLVRYDDGAAVYIDGVEVGRLNLPSGDLTADTLASSTVSGDAETSFTRIGLDPMTLAEGEVVVAVELHQASVTSSDVVLDLSLSLERIEVVD